MKLAGERRTFRESSGIVKWAAESLRDFAMRPEKQRRKEIERMENSYRFFANKACKYYPCHEGIEELNCLFCFCPMYSKKNCPGNPTYLEQDGKRLKACDGCTFPHRPENYDLIMEQLRKVESLF